VAIRGSLALRDGAPDNIHKDKVESSAVGMLPIEGGRVSSVGLVRGKVEGRGARKIWKRRRCTGPRKSTTVISHLVEAAISVNTLGNVRSDLPTAMGTLELAEPYRYAGSINCTKSRLESSLEFRGEEDAI
jgi:hypothetical protein